MGIGRRDFLKLFGTTLASIAIATSPAVALLDDWYINRKLGIAFRKPHGWHFADVADMGMVIQGQKLALDDIELERKLKGEEHFPLLTISKEPIGIGAQKFTPGINIYLEQYTRTAGGKSKSPMEGMLKDILFNGQVLSKFKVISAPVEISVSKCKSVRYISSFLFEHNDLNKPTLVRMDSLTIVQEPAWYTIRMYDSPFRGSEKTVDYSGFIDSIQII